MWGPFKEWFVSLPWLQVIPIAIAVIVAFISYLESRKSLIEAKNATELSNKANEIAKEALSRATMQFTTLNRPVLAIRPVPFGKGNNYFEIAILDKEKLIVKILIGIKNLGNMVADNTFLHSANCMLYINNILITGDKKEYETVSGKLTLMDIPPNEEVLKIVTLDFQLPPNLDIEKFHNDLISSCRMDTNFLLHYYSHYEKEETLASNISYAISYHWYSVLMIKL